MHYITVFLKLVYLSKISFYLLIGLILSSFALIYRVTKGPGGIQDSMIITTLTTPVVFPSLIMILLILSEFGEVPGRYFGSAVELYLAGIASLFIVLPILGIISHWYNLIKVRGSPISHILYTLVILSILNFIVIKINKL